MNNYFSILLLLFLLNSCSSGKVEQELISGCWEGEYDSFKFYNNGKISYMEVDGSVDDILNTKYTIKDNILTIHNSTYQILLLEEKKIKMKKQSHAGLGKLLIYSKVDCGK